MIQTKASDTPQQAADDPTAGDVAPDAPPPPSPGPLARLLRVARLARLTGKRVLALLGLGVTLAGLYHFYAPLVTGPPPKQAMTGDLNVAIAGLSPAPGTAKADAGGLGESLARAVQDEVRSLRAGTSPLDIQVAGPKQVGTIGGSDTAERLTTARRLSGELRADVLVYGTVQRLPDALELRLEFLFSPQHVAHPEDRQPLLSAVSLPPTPSGREQIGTIRETGVAAADVMARARLRSRAAARARAFAAFIVGLGHLTDAVGRMADGRPAGAQLRLADQMLRSTDASGQWDPRVGHVLHLLLGNVALLRNRYGTAEQEYRTALRFQPDYTRAAFGASEARFLRSAGGCDPASADGRGLMRSMRGYRGVLEQLGGTPSLLRSKAEFGLGRAALCASYAGFTRSWATARRAFDHVLAAGPAVAASRAQVAQAHGGLGLVVLITGDTTRGALEGAVRHFERAIALTPASPQQGALWSFLGNARAQLGDRTAARAAYAKAIALDPANRDRYREEMEDVLRG